MFVCVCDRYQATVGFKGSRALFDLQRTYDSLMWAKDYQQALAVKERQAIPVVGEAIDRRAFEQTTLMYNDEKIKCLICFVCACICINAHFSFTTTFV